MVIARCGPVASLIRRRLTCVSRDGGRNHRVCPANDEQGGYSSSLRSGGSIRAGEKTRIKGMMDKERGERNGCFAASHVKRTRIGGGIGKKWRLSTEGFRFGINFHFIFQFRQFLVSQCAHT